jgi:hypothetical protein
MRVFAGTDWDARPVITRSVRLPFPGWLRANVAALSAPRSFFDWGVEHCEACDGAWRRMLAFVARLIGHAAWV